jgi:hypothetical protein
MTMTYELCTISPDVEAATRAISGIPAHVRIDLHITPEDIPVRGNASAWGEPEDSEHAESIEHRLADGDLWAWCTVRVTCTDGDVKGAAYLGAATYEHTADFIQYGYLQDMVQEAYDEYEGNREDFIKYGYTLPIFRRPSFDGGRRISPQA